MFDGIFNMSCFEVEQKNAGTSVHMPHRRLSTFDLLSLSVVVLRYILSRFAKKSHDTGISKITSSS